MTKVSSGTLNARTLRRNQTNPEWLLWQQLRRKQLDGVKFRRQQTIGKYIVDFVSYEKRLIIEVDGETHSKEREVIYDTERSAYLESLGYTVEWFWNYEITKNIEEVIEKIKNFSPLSNSLPQGERISTEKILRSQKDTL